MRPPSISPARLFTTTARAATKMDRISSADMFKGVDVTAMNRAGRTFAGQGNLPRLPVPSLKQTLDKYLRSTEPLHSSPEEAEATKKAVQSALAGADAALVRQLQSRLVSRAEGKASWLADWWNEMAYFGYRDAILPNVNYFYCHAAIPGGTSNLSVAPRLVKAFLAYRGLVEKGELEPDMGKSGPLDMSSALWLFNSCRIPRAELDYATKADPGTNNHLVVLRNGKYWSFDLLHPATGEELSEKEIQIQLERILQDPASSEPEPYPVGALTGVNRDTWAKARDELAASPLNCSALETIESSVFVLALDNDAPTTSQEKAWALWTGGKGALNRFFDKQELIVFDNGVSGFNGEHSTMDGGPTARLNDFTMTAVIENKLDMGKSNEVSSSNLPSPRRLEFDLSPASKDAIQAAQAEFDATMHKYEQVVLNFGGYGKDLIKALGVSPDGWVQMMIQLAYRKLYGKPTAVYESAQTRKFLLGRTEVVRSCSPESTAFCRAFLDRSLPEDKLYTLFQAAIKQHISYARDAADGRGVDRHLLGLKKSLQPGESVPHLFTDPAFTNSSTWRLSTSQVASEHINFLGFGPVAPGGYGCAYSIKRRSIDIVISAAKADAQAHELAHYLQESALELQAFISRIKQDKAHA